MDGQALKRRRRQWTTWLVIMIKQGNNYYWLGENRDGTNLVSLYRSTDLKNWEFRAHLLSKSMGGELATEKRRPSSKEARLTSALLLEQRDGTPIKPSTPLPQVLKDHGPTR